MESSSNDLRSIFIPLFRAKSSGLCAEFKKTLLHIFPKEQARERESEKSQQVLGENFQNILENKGYMRFKKILFSSHCLCVFSLILNGNGGQMPFASLFLHDLIWVLLPSLQPFKLLFCESKHRMRITGCIY